jgi:hypothetical protein
MQNRKKQQQRRKLPALQRPTKVLKTMIWRISTGQDSLTERNSNFANYSWSKVHISPHASRTLSLNTSTSFTLKNLIEEAIEITYQSDFEVLAADTAMRLLAKVADSFLAP